MSDKQAEIERKRGDYFRDVLVAKYGCPPFDVHPMCVYATCPFMYDGVVDYSECWDDVARKANDARGWADATHAALDEFAAIARGNQELAQELEAELRRLVDIMREDGHTDLTYAQVIGAAFIGRLFESAWRRETR